MVHDRNALKMPVTNSFAAQPGMNDITGVICRKKGMVSVQHCAMCPEFQPPDAAKDLAENDVLEGMTGIDPRTGNSYATCKWFGEIIRANPFYAEVRRLQERKFGRY